MADQQPSNNISLINHAILKKAAPWLILLMAVAGLLLTRLYSYLLFHALAEIFSIIVAFGVFIVAWNSSPLVKNNYLLILGVGSLFIALIDFLHTLAYKDMGVFTGFNANLPTQLWLAARYFQALIFLVAPLSFHFRIQRGPVLAAFALITTLLLISIFVIPIFPTAYVENVGLTPFKIYSEYGIIAILIASIGLLWRNRSEFDATVLKWLVGSIIATIIAEFAFTSYVGVTDIANLLGHVFKILAFYLLYRAVVDTGFVRPYNLIFRQLKLDEASERKARGEAEEQVREMALFPTLNPDAVLQVNASGQIIMANPAAVELGLSNGVQLVDVLPDFLALDIPACIANGSTTLIQEMPLGERILQWTIRGVPELNLAFLYSKDVTQRKQAEQEVEASARAWRETFDAMSEFVSVHDKNFQIVRANKSLANYFGKQPKELIGQYCYELFHGTDEPWPGCPHAKAMISGDSVTTEVEDENIGCPLLVSVSPLFDTNGAMLGSVHIAKDITERKRAEERIELERSKLKNILDTMADGVYIVNPDYEIEYSNPAIERQYGKAAGRACYEYLHDLTESCPWCVMDKILQGEVVRSEWSSPKHDMIYELIDAPIKQSDGNVYKLGIRHDITQLKENEKRLLQANLNLENATQAERNQRQLAEALVDAALVLNQSQDLDEVLLLILEKIKEVVPYKLAAITLLEDDLFYDAYRQGEPVLIKQQTDAKKRYPIEDFPLLERMRQSGQPILLHDTQLEQNWIQVSEFEWCRSFLSAPLIVENQVIGFVNLFSDQIGYFSERTRDRLVAFAVHAAVAVHNAWLVKKIKKSSERLQSLSHRLVDIQESERQLIARELHDEAGQMLTSLKLDLHLLSKKVSEPDRVAQKVAEMLDSVDEIQENLHSLAVTLRPASLDHVGLVSAIQQHVESIGQKQGLKVGFKADEFQRRLPPNVETVLYRIVQEALTNIIRHAQATQVDVLLTSRDNKLILIIEDDGLGFDPDNIPTRNHLGLFSMRERAEMIGGMLVIESTPGFGTTIMVEVSRDNLIASEN